MALRLALRLGFSRSYTVVFQALLRLLWLLWLLLRPRSRNPVPSVSHFCLALKLPEVLPRRGFTRPADASADCLVRAGRYGPQGHHGQGQDNHQFAHRSSSSGWVRLDSTTRTVVCQDSFSILLISLSKYQRAFFRSSKPFLSFQRQMYLMTLAVHTASMPSKPVVAASMASMHSTVPAV